MALRLLVFDRTCIRRGLGLSTCWRGGAKLYGALGRIDASLGAASWDEALTWLSTVRKTEQIVEIQYWGHGKWGSALLDGDALDGTAFRDRHPHLPKLAAIRERMAPDALLWFRTCETFGAQRGVDFAKACTGFFGARAAGHTHVIGYWQSGLRGLAPGHAPDWSPREGLEEGTPEEPRRAKGSSPTAPRTITCLDGAVPAAWFA